jgi:predicted O-methyltransferase YrrM
VEVLKERVRFRPAAMKTALAELAGVSTLEEHLAFARRYFAPGPNQVDDEILGFLRLAQSREPKVVVEIGTQSGGNTFLLSRALPTVEVVVAVDLYVGNRAKLHAFQRPATTLHVVDGSSYADDTVAHITSLLGGRSVDLLFIDGDHTFAGAALDFWQYRSKVTDGGLVGFHDIVPDDLLRYGRKTDKYAGEVPLLWEELRGQYTAHEFVTDWDREGLGIGAIEYDAAVEPRMGPARTRTSSGTT